MKIQIGQIEVKAGHPATNTAKMLEIIELAKKDTVDLLIFPELCIPGYLIGDLWEMEDFLRDCEKCGEKIRAASQGITIIFGNIGLDHAKINEDGRIRKYNALFMAENQEFIEPENFQYPFTIKTLLPNYREFDDSRYFYSLEKLALEMGLSVDVILNPFDSRLGRFACILCEDGWDSDYHLSPIEILSKKNPDIFINISCSPFTLNKNDKRNRTFGKKAEKYQKPLIYVNNVGLQNNGKTLFTFDGHSTVYNTKGEFETIFPSFQEKTQIFEFKDNGIITITPTQKIETEIEQIFQSIQYGTKLFMKQLGLEKVVIGLSGGIDSAVAAALYGTILDKDKILLVNMPSRFNADITKNLALELASNLGCFYTQIPIDESVALTKKQMDNLNITSPDKKLSLELKLSSFAFENIQARDRSSRILSALSSAFGGPFTSNANKAETTVGYSTLYGDHAGFLANIADLWKFHVYELGKYLNEAVYKKEIIPAKIFTIVPSAELSEKQDITKGLGDPIIYEYHDLLFKSWVERWVRATPETILHWYQNGTITKELKLLKPIDQYFKSAEEFIADLEKWWNLYQGMGIAKRIQAPPILAVTRRAFGFDHRESQCGVYYTMTYHKLKKEILENKK
jgi:NAD+ synthase (glutamine-hydrolysing)